jgi:hypothetical protein
MSGVTVSDTQWRSKSLLFRANRIPFPDPLLTNSYAAVDATTSHATTTSSGRRRRSSARNRAATRDPQVVQSAQNVEDNAAAGVTEGDVVLDVVGDVVVTEPVGAGSAGGGESGTGDGDVAMSIAVPMAGAEQGQSSTSLEGVDATETDATEAAAATEVGATETGATETGATDTAVTETAATDTAIPEAAATATQFVGSSPTRSVPVSSSSSDDTAGAVAAPVPVPAAAPVPVPEDEGDCGVPAEVVLLRNANLVFFDVAMMYPRCKFRVCLFTYGWSQRRVRM